MQDVVTPYLCTGLTFEEKLHNPRWEAVLSDGTTVFSHSNRRSWLELKAFLENSPNIHIVSLRFGFRDNYVDIHSGEASYFFTHSVLCEYGGPTKFYFIGGFRDGEIVRCKKYLVPEMFLVEEEIRSLDDPSVIKGLIRGNL